MNEVEADASGTQAVAGAAARDRRLAARGAPDLPVLYDLSGRILLAVPFLLAGIDKLLNPQSSIEALAGAGLTSPVLLNYAAAVLEIVGAVCLVARFQVWAAALALLIYLVPLTFFMYALPAHENPAARLDVFRNVAIAGGLVILAGVHRRDVF